MHDGGDEFGENFGGRDVGVQSVESGVVGEHTVLRCVERGMVGEKEEDAEIAVETRLRPPVVFHIFLLRWYTFMMEWNESGRWD